MMMLMTHIHCGKDVVEQTLSHPPFVSSALMLDTIILKNLLITQNGKGIEAKLEVVWQNFIASSWQVL